MSAELAMIDGSVGFDLSWLAKFGSLLFLPFAHEDLAIIAGGYIVVNKLMPVGFVAATIFIGMVVSDVALYGIGFGARRLPWLSRVAVDDSVRRFGKELMCNLFGLAALCRLVPGVVFVACVACGWSRVPFRNFTMASLTTSALYLPLMLYLVVEFGGALDDRLGLWAWLLVLAAVVLVGLVRHRVFSLRDDHGAAYAAAADADVPPADTRRIGELRARLSTLRVRRALGDR